MLIIRKDQKLYKYPSVGECLDKLWYMHIMENNTAIKTEETGTLFHISHNAGLISTLMLKGSSAVFVVIANVYLNVPRGLSPLNYPMLCTQKEGVLRHTTE